MEASTQQTEIRYRPDIDGLRAIAILSVVAYHIGLPWVTGGYTGVDVFFVISGFLITQLLLKEAYAQGTISIANFYARRIRRILPSLAIVLTVTLLLGVLFLPDFGEKRDLSKSAIAAVFFSANQYFLASTGGYFSGPSELLPLLHLWSLSVEEQFYLVWPLILILAVKFFPPRTRIARIRTLVIFLIICSFIISSWLIKTNPSAAFFVLPSRAWELGAGALLALVPARRNGVGRPVLATGTGLAGAALIAVGFFRFSDATVFPGASASIPVLGSSLIIFAGLTDPRNLVSRVLSVRPLVAIGLLSYSWYLWHWPLLSIVRNNRRLSESTLSVDCAMALIALGCAAVSVRFVENPIRHYRGAKVAQKAVLFAGAATLTLLLLIAGAVGAWVKFRPESPYLATFERERPPLGCLSGRIPGQFMTFHPPCDQAPAGRAVGQSPLAVIWGDSHADVWSTSVRLLAQADGIEMRELAFETCPPLIDATVVFNTKVVPNCRQNNEEVLAGLQQLRNENPQRKIGVVLAARWPGYLGTFPIPFRDRAPDYPRFYSKARGSVAENLEALRCGLDKTIGALQKLNIKVLILLDGPEFRLMPLRCVALGYTEAACSESRRDVEAYRRSAVDAVRQVAREFPDVRVVDSMPFFCPLDTCSAFINGYPVVFDDSHISVSAARAFAPLMRKDFRWLFEHD